jgi:hypothetical protein
MEKTYSITIKNTTLEPYWQDLKDGSNPEIEYTDKQSYKKLNLETALLVLKEIIDAPDSELTLNSVKEDFKFSNSSMSDGVAQKIVDYYNGRKKIYEDIKDLLESGEFEYEKIAIPEELNGFTTQENDEEFKKIQILEYWIEVRAE